jgi:hypothetical protein
LLSSCGTSTSKLILSGYSGFIIITFSVSLFGMLSLYEPLRQYESLLSLLRTSLLQTVVASTKLLHWWLLGAVENFLLLLNPMISCASNVILSLGLRWFGKLGLCPGIISFCG